MINKISDLIYYTGLILIINLFLFGCIAGKDIYINSLPADYMKPVTPDTTVIQTPISVDTDSAEVYIPVEDNYDARLRHMRLISFYHPKLGGGGYTLSYIDGKIVYAAIMSVDNTTQEDIVFFRENWYYNQNDQRKLIDQKQADLFVQTIQAEILSQEKTEIDGGS